MQFGAKKGPAEYGPFESERPLLLSTNHESLSMISEVDLAEFLCVVLQRPGKHCVIGRRFLQVLDFTLRGGDSLAILYEVNLYIIGRTIPLSLIVAGGKLCRSNLHGL